MPDGVTLLLHASPESWSEADYAEWDADLHVHGFLADGESLASPPLGGAGPVTVALDERPEEGRFAFTVARAEWRADPEYAFRVLLGIARLLAERVDVRFAVVDEDARCDRGAAPPSALRDARLGLAAVVGADLVAASAAERFGRVPGVVVEPLARGALLLFVPPEALRVEGERDLRARVAEAERHLGVEAAASPASGIAAAVVRPLVQLRDSTVSLGD